VLRPRSNRARWKITRINPSGEVEATDETVATEKACGIQGLGHEGDGAAAVTSGLPALAGTAA
jgi:hypothetical protein